MTLVSSSRAVSFWSYGSYNLERDQMFRYLRFELRYIGKSLFNPTGNVLQLLGQPRTIKCHLLSGHGSAVKRLRQPESSPCKIVFFTKRGEKGLLRTRSSSIRKSDRARVVNMAFCYMPLKSCLRGWFFEEGL